MHSDYSHNKLLNFYFYLYIHETTRRHYFPGSAHLKGLPTSSVELDHLRKAMYSFCRICLLLIHFHKWLRINTFARGGEETPLPKGYLGLL